LQRDNVNIFHGDDLYATTYNHGCIFMSMTTPGQRIRQRRIELGLRQGEFARLCGISQSGLSDLERGDNRLPSAETLHVMAEILKVTPAWIITGKNGELTVPTDQEQELLTQFRELDDSKKAALMGLLATFSK
jgi:transcriptional regulator with XRE-family HTH domain